MAQKLAAILVIALIAITGCDQPTVLPEDVVGTWTLSEETRTKLPETLRGIDSKLVLLSTGTFAAEDIPAGLVILMPENVNQPLSGSGYWFLALRDGQQVVQLNFHSFSDNAIQDTPFGTQMDVSGDHNTVSLYYYQGDPDSSLKVEFEKR